MKGKHGTESETEIPQFTESTSVLLMSLRWWSVVSECVKNDNKKAWKQSCTHLREKRNNKVKTTVTVGDETRSLVWLNNIVSHKLECSNTLTLTTHTQTNSPFPPPTQLMQACNECHHGIQCYKHVFTSMLQICITIHFGEAIQLSGTEKWLPPSGLQLSLYTLTSTSIRPTSNSIHLLLVCITYHCLVAPLWLSQFGANLTELNSLTI